MDEHDAMRKKLRELATELRSIADHAVEISTLTEECLASFGGTSGMPLVLRRWIRLVEGALCVFPMYTMPDGAVVRTELVEKYIREVEALTVGGIGV